MRQRHGPRRVVLWSFSIFLEFGGLPGQWRDHSPAVNYYGPKGAGGFSQSRPRDPSPQREGYFTSSISPGRQVWLNHGSSGP